MPPAFVQELEDKTHDVIFVLIARHPARGLPIPELLMPFVRGARKRIAARMSSSHAQRPCQTNLEQALWSMGKPEQDAMTQQKVALMEKVLSRVSQRDRDILDRYYIQEWTEEQICGDMSVTKTQFRLLKSRIKVNFEKLSLKAGDWAQLLNADSHIS
jgi:hypothetical protein